MSATAAKQYSFESPPPIGTPEHADWLVHWHFEFENPDQIHLLGELYTDDIVWELPSAGIIFHGKHDVIDNYRRTFDVLDLSTFEFRPIDRFATADRVFDDREVFFTVTDLEAFPMPGLNIVEGQGVKMRLSHSFHIRSGLISRENVYQIFTPVQ
ncbi:MAG TPA: nuclear transport factor 2 family protein [Allosphingosinicella sp.]|nr:nuclear transport factor 2 family protein [Allosphingosinicella sp.]